MVKRSQWPYIAVAAMLMIALLVITACGAAPAASPTAAPAPPTAAPAKPAATTAPTAVPAAQPAAAPTAALKGGITPEQKAAALKEGEVTYYSATSTATATRIKEQAEKDLGIKVNVVRLSSSLSFNRAVKEFEEGVNAADVIETSLVEHFLEMKKKGMLQPFTPASINLYRSRDYYDADHYWHASWINLVLINYNSNLLKGDMIPKTWKELTDPKYKDKLAQGHIKASGTSATIDYFLVKMYGWEYFEGLKKNNIMTQQSCDLTNILTQGERVIGLCVHLITAGAQLQGLPIESVFPTDGVFGQIGPAALLAKAPHPNAGRLFLDWFTGPIGQALYVQSGILSPIESPEIKYPAQYPDPKQIKLLFLDLKEFSEWLPAGREKFSEMFGG